MDDVLSIFSKIYTCPCLSGDEILECFNVLVQHRLIDIAVMMGGHLLKAGEKVVIDLDQ